MILSRIASATGPLPSLSCQPSGENWEAKIVVFLLVLISKISNISFLSISLVEVKRKSSIIADCHKFWSIKTH